MLYRESNRADRWSSKIGVSSIPQSGGSIIAPRKRKRSRNCTDCRSTSIPCHPYSTARGSVLPHRSRICNQTHRRFVLSRQSIFDRSLISFQRFSFLAKEMAIFLNTYLKLFGSPTFQFSKVIGLPLAIQKKVPSSAWSVPEVQKCSCPRPKSLICFSSLSFSSWDAMLARCIPWYRQYWDALYQLAWNMRRIIRIIRLSIQSFIFL